jgi:hypothetical protein
MCQKIEKNTNVREGHDSFLVWGGYRGSGVAQPGGGGTLEYRTQGGDIPHQGRGGCWSGPKKEGGPLIKNAYPFVI